MNHKKKATIYLPFSKIIFFIRPSLGFRTNSKKTYFINSIF